MSTKPAHKIRIIPGWGKIAGFSWEISRKVFAKRGSQFFSKNRHFDKWARIFSSATNCFEIGKYSLQKVKKVEL